ncbi:MAG: PAS domain-containing sensor histidine kinase [Ginsengibacter sp.]
MELSKSTVEYSAPQAEEMESIFQNSIYAVVITDEMGKILLWNPKAVKVFNYGPKEVVGKLFFTLLTNEARLEYYSLMKEYEGSDFADLSGNYVESIGLKKDQTEINISLGISPTVFKGNKYFIYYINDITNRKQIATALDKQKEFYENILNKLPTDIAVFDANHKYLFVNPGAISVEEYRKFIVGKDDYEYAAYRNRPVSTADERREQFLQVKNTGKEIRWEDSLPDPNGNIITHLRRMFPVHDENGDLSMVIGFGIDITERKLMEVKQAGLVEQLSAQNVQLIDFCNIVSHNLRAPLVNISMLVELIEKSTTHEKQAQYISKLKPVIENLHTTFNELVESIQIKHDLEIKSEKINFKHCFERTLEGLASEVIKSEATFIPDFETEFINFPPKYLFSIFHNLLSNALKYQSPSRKLNVKISTKKYADKILLSVEDNGLGVDLEKHRSSFFKIGKVFHRHANAKGFGLYMTKTQVEAMNGKIWVESTPDVGSTFFIEFANQQ